MAQIARHPSYPNVLLLFGNDVYSSDFRSILNGLANTPVTLNTHDFWVINRLNGAGPNSTNCSMGNSRLKMCINMNSDITSTTSDAAKAYINTFLHEAGHYWLVPHFEMMLGNRIGSYVTTKGTPDFINAFFRSEDIPSLCLLAKEDSHWNCFMSAGQTTFEALDWILQRSIPLEGTAREGEEFENILREYIPNPTASNISGTIGAYTNQDIYRPYSDLDLTIMGVKRNNEAYTNNQNTFYELTPQWLSNINTLTGICLVFSPTDIIHFGFKDGHQKLCVQRTGSTLGELSIQNFYTPESMWNFDSHIALRIIRRGNTYYCQARQEITRIGCLASILSAMRLYNPPSQVDLFSDTQNLQPNPPANVTHLDNWVTIASFSDNGTPIAGGYMVKTWGGAPPLVDTHFSNFQVQSQITPVRTINTMPTSTVTDNTYPSRLNNEFIYHLPKIGPVLIPDRDLLNLVIGATTPSGEVGSHDHWTGVDNAPKLLTRIDNGDFVMGGKVKIKRSAMAPHAAGAASNSTLWAFRRERRLIMNGINNLRLSEDSVLKQDDSSPYKYAFIILAPDRASITDTMIQNVDAYRQSCSSFFAQSTLNRRSITTGL